MTIAPTVFACLLWVAVAAVVASVGYLIVRWLIDYKRKSLW